MSAEYIKDEGLLAKNDHQESKGLKRGGDSAELTSGDWVGGRGHRRGTGKRVEADLSGPSWKGASKTPSPSGHCRHRLCAPPADDWGQRASPAPLEKEGLLVL